MPVFPDVIAATMKTQVGVVSDSPVYSRGLITILTDEGLQVAPLPADFDPHPRAGLAAAIVATAPAECFRLLTRVSDRLPVVVMMADSTGAEHRRALRLGAHSVLSRNTEPATIVRAVHAGAARESLLPYGFTQSLLTTPDEAIDHPPLGAREIEWIRRMASGGSINQIAAEAGCSERGMFRHLTAVYRSMGVQNRSQAIAQAARWGLLSEADGARRPRQVR